MEEWDPGLGGGETYETRLAALDETLAIIVHELKNPLAVMQGFATTLVNAAEAMDPEAVVKAAKAVEKGAHKMEALLGSLSDASAFGGGQMELHLKDVLVSDLVGDAIRDLQTVSPDHQLFCSIEDDVLVRVDITRIQQVLVNLLSNAVKFSPPGSTVEVNVSRDEDVVTVGVADDGPGIPPERADELFRKFSRLGSQMKGTGLGLYLSRLIARAHGGDLELGDAGGRGCEFLLRLPIHSSQTEDSLPTHSKHRPR